MSPPSQDADWIAADWGTSRLRLWGMRGAEPVWRAASDAGMGTLEPDQFEGALRAAMGDRAPAPVVACGMVGARGGWVEAPYRAVPCAPLAEGVRAPGDLDVRVVPGLSQAQPPDVMRGEETQVAGLLAAEPRLDGVALLPGTHAKWVHVSAGEVVSFRTAMTGEVFALLSERSVLRHAVGAGGPAGEGHDEAAFLEAMSDAMARPEALTARLFEVRARALLEGAAPAASRARLSGLLIGAELAATRPYWLGRDVVLVASGPIADLYAAALAAQGAPPRVVDPEPLTLAGLAAARALTTPSPPPSPTEAA